ncbi:alpha/beta hydrolase [Microbacterium sp.]|uniref:alpha/beta hydrolase n=1 Tax=Microbacterium sp. TaxID=51671 RepID=UPI003F72116A
MTAPRAVAVRPRNGADVTRGSRRRVLRGLAGLTAGLFAMCCLLPTGLSAAAADAVDAPLGFEDARCAVPVPESRVGDVRCGYLTVPESRAADADPEQKLRLPVVIVRSESPERVTDPLVVPVAGTADASGLGALGYFLTRPAWVGDRDVVLVERRGDLHAEPSLDCPELAGVLTAAQRVDRTRACHDRLVDEGVDPAAYTSAAIAADLGDLYVALGYDTWNLYGAGEGSRLALAVLRDRPAGVRSVILDGPRALDVDLATALPASVTAALDAVVEDCRADDGCRARYPDLAGRVETALARADREPFTVTVDDPVSGDPAARSMEGAAVVRALIAALQDPRSARAVPYVIDRLSRGDADAVLPFAQRSLGIDARPAEGLALSIACAEEFPFHDPDALASAQDASVLAAHVGDAGSAAAECEAWAVPAADARENAVVTSSVPTLVISGEYDPTAAWSDAAATGLARHYAYLLPATGAAAVWNGGCAASIARQFLEDPATEPRSGCIERTPAPQFLTAADVHATSAVYRLDSDVRTAPRPGQIGIAIATVLVFVGTLVYGVVYALRRRWDAPPGTVFAAVSAAALNLAFVGILGLVLATADPLVLAFGLPAAAWPLLLLPFAALACAVVLVVLLVRAWMQDDGGLAHRVILTVSALGTLGFAVWLLVRGLLAL